MHGGCRPACADQGPSLELRGAADVVAAREGALVERSFCLCTQMFAETLQTDASHSHMTSALYLMPGP